jgi:FtsH-binding integral membrane protein
MDEQIKYIDETTISSIQASFLRKVYAWMVGGLLITAFTSFWVIENNDSMKEIVRNFWIFIILEFVLVIALSGFAMKMSKAVAGFCFIAYSFLNGLTLSLILVQYSLDSVISTFFVASAMFGALSAFGYFTKRNLSGLGSFMFMGLIGIIIASIVNIFIASSAIHFIVSYAGVLIFAGLTAYDTQKLKEMAIIQLEDGELASKGAIVGALILYLDFINLLLMLLRIFGGRR